MEKKLLELLYIKYHKSAFLYVFSLCKRKEAAEDIVSQAFEKAMLSVELTDESFYFWLLRVCKNLWLDGLRKEKWIAAIPVESIDLIQVDKAIDQLLEKEKNQQLYKAIQRLPEKDRELLTLHYFAEIPLTQIAAMNRESYASIKTRLHRARLKLKKILNERTDVYEV